MAKQKGIIKLEGTLNDITFLKTRDGYIAKEKTSITASRIATDPAFARTRENGAEFGRAGKAGKLLRNAFRTQLQSARDRSTTGRLTREMMRVVKSDAVNGRGMRGVMDGEKTLLQDFDFNESARLSSTIFVPYTATLNRVTGEATVTLPAFTPANSIVAPAGTTHFSIGAAAAAIDFEGETYEADAAASGTLPWNGIATPPLTLTCNLLANSTGTLFMVLGIEFFQVVNGNNYSLNNGAFNALAIVQVNQL